MTTTTTTTATTPTRTELGAERAFMLLRTVFTIAPIAFGLDKFAEVLTDDWEGYLAPWVNDIVPGSAHQAMLAVGVIEIVAGIAVAVVAPLRRAAGGRLAGRHHREPGVASATTTTSPCVTSDCSSPPWRSPSWPHDRGKPSTSA